MYDSTEFLAAVILCIILRRNGEVRAGSPLLGCGGENWGSWAVEDWETEGS